MINDRQEHDIGKIRTLLTQAFTAKDLRRFCQDRLLFRPICDRFGSALKLNDMVDEVIDYCKTQDLFDELLAEVKQVNPRQYACYGYEIHKGPVLDEDGRPSSVVKAQGPHVRGPVRPVQERGPRGGRLGVERELGLETVHVPAGPFLMGSDRRKDRHETPQHVCVLPAFQIGRHPVTNRQYSAFVEATGREPPAVWYQGRFDPEQADHPVVYVSWHEAQAYVAWLREQTGRPYRLPTEAEWEKAARGDDGRLWPWGTIWDPARVNCKQAGPGETTPVGEYSPQGDSPYGCADMAGNVLEWTQTMWGRDWECPDFSYPYDPGDGRENLDASRLVFRVLRGGSFFSHSVFVRCTCRYWDWADSRDAYVGFRVAMDPGLREL